MAKSEIKDLGYLGEEFQKKLIHTFMEDKEFFRDLSGIIDQNMFTNITYRDYVGKMKDYYDKYEVVPSYSSMDLYLREKVRNSIDLERVLTLNQEFQTDKSSEAIDFIKETSSRFFKQQKIVSVANQILQVAGKGEDDKYDECAKLLNEAISVGEKDNVGENVFENLNETLSDDYRVTIPTGIIDVDKVLEGGIGKGELGVIIGSSGFGKTSMTTALASHAATCQCEANNNQGFKVLQIVFEDRIKQIQRKHIGKITNIEAKDLSKPEYIEIVKQRLENYDKKQLLENNLKIVRFPSGEITASFLERYIKRLMNGGFSPDLVIIDYFECLAHEKSLSRESNEFSEEGKTMRKLEALANKLNIAFWIPSQGTKDSINLELVTMDKIGGSVKKAQIAHIILSIARSIEDAENNIATIALLKNRAGKSGAVWNDVYFNNGTCEIRTNSESDSIIEFGKKREDKITDLAQKIAKSMSKMKN